MSEIQIDAKGPSWHALPPGEIAAALESDPEGLPGQRAEARRARVGPNQLEEAPPPSALLTFAGQFRSPLIYILVAACAVTVALGKYVDAAVIAVILVLNAVIGFVQERKAEFSVRALMKLVSPKARILRDGREQEVDSRELVPGDLVLLESGTRVPADLRLVGTHALAIDESILTGESMPVHKHEAPLPSDTPLADRRNLAFAGTMVTTGRGRGFVVATGGRTELGKIAGEIREGPPPPTPLQQRMHQLGRLITWGVVVSCVVAFGVGVLLGRPVAEMFLTAVALAVAAVPEALPIVLTVTLAVGVGRMARRHAIVRRLPSIETLGSTTVIGSDKTGTLTENRMTVEEIWAGRRTFTLPMRPPGEALVEHHPLYLTLLAGALSNEADAFYEGDRLQTRGDPTEAALLVAADAVGLDHEALREEYRAFSEIPFEPERRYSASIRDRGHSRMVFVKGAPERVLRMCGSMLGDAGPQALDEAEISRQAEALGARGLRVLALAWSEDADRTRPPSELDTPDGLTFLGLVGMMDPPREGVREAVEGCRAAGMRVLMITGDHAVTAKAIARRLGLEAREALTGAQLDALDDRQFREAMGRTSVFARVSPEQKLRIVRALQAAGEVVAITGDGVNDAPALKAADIGVAMGRGGTDVAREAADVVLTDDNFVSIYAAVEEGRVVFDNLRKVIFFLLSAGAAEILVILAALGLGWPIPLLPAQLLWLNLVTNSLQDIALALEPGDKDVLQRRPRARGEGLVSGLLWERTALGGGVMAAATLLLYRWELDASGSVEGARTVALTAMVVMMALQVGNARSETESVFRRNPLSNPFLLVATVAALVLHVAALFIPPLQFVLRIAPITDAGTWLRIVAVSLSILVATELHKLVRRDKRRHVEPAARQGEGSVRQEEVPQ